MMAWLALLMTVLHGISFAQTIEAAGCPDISGRWLVTATGEYCASDMPCMNGVIFPFTNSLYSFTQAESSLMAHTEPTMVHAITVDIDGDIQDDVTLSGIWLASFGRVSPCIDADDGVTTSGDFEAEIVNCREINITSINGFWPRFSPELFNCERLDDLTFSGTGSAIRVDIPTLDLEVSGVSDENEETIGGFVGTNEDDDNNNGIIDKDEDLVDSEDDLLMISVSITDDTFADGTVRLEVISNGRKARIWSRFGRNRKEIKLPQEWEVRSREIPGVLFVEALSESNLRDVEIELSYLKNGVVLDSDRIALTFFQANFFIYVDQPGEGGDRDYWELPRDVGHAWWEFQVSRPEVISDANLGRDKELLTFSNRTMGFYPESLAIPGVNEITQGIFVMPDTEHRPNITRNFSINRQELIRGLRFSSRLNSFPRNYDINEMNCTDMAIQAAASAGVILPDTRGDWVSGGGSNPGDLGEDLRERFPQ